MTLALLAEYGSPLYVYEGDRLRQTIAHITAAVPYARSQFRFASVTNGNLALLNIFKQSGWGLHANTPGDIYLGLQAGFAPAQIVYSGSNLSLEEMTQLFRWGVSVLNLDSLSQLQLCCDVYRTLIETDKPPAILLGLRLNEPALTGNSRIGVRPEDFPQAVAIAQSAQLKISGLHFYRGTGTNATEAFTQVIDRVLAIAHQLTDWKYLDFGGGFGHPYRTEGAAFDWPAFGKAISVRLEKMSANIELVIEPGRAAIAGCATLLTTVVSTKWQGDKQIVGVDTTVANLSVPSVHGGYRRVELLTDAFQENSVADRGKCYTTDVCGNTTYSRDYLAKGCLIPELQPGDVLKVLDVGAYGYAMSSHFLHRPRPAEVLIENGRHRLIRQRESYQVLIDNQIFRSASSSTPNVSNKKL